jgi:asparagine synthase (glutamine-hydrolysing)
MCGIAGILTPGLETARRAVALMNRAQRHRGPDHSGELFLRVGSRWLGLANTRLAVIDRSEAGHQPMVNLETGDCLTFNGEITNHARLVPPGLARRSRTDTEVLLRWGARAPEALDGMFAFAFFDAARSTLTLARDPAGIKPLYWADLPDGFAFASETRALLAAGLVDSSIDREGLAGYLAYGALQEPLTLFSSIRSLEPGRLFEWSLGESLRKTSRPFWSFPAPSRRIDPEEVGSALQESVRDHLASDVPWGIFLSSGIDSTLIATLAARAAGRVRTFTVHSNGEGEPARRTADRIGAEHHEIRIEEERALDWARRWLRALDQPTIDGLNTFVVSRAARETGIVVAVSGLGGDELFGGYPTFRDVPRFAAGLSRSAWIPSNVRQAAAWVASAGRSSAARQKAVDLAESDGTLACTYLRRRRLHSNAAMKRLGYPAEGEFVPALPVGAPGDAEASVARFEFQTYLRNMLLRDSDGASMANSLELRVPILSRRMIDLMMSAPGDSFKPPKRLLRDAFPGLLPPRVTGLPKRGFVLPMARWMKGPMREECREAIESLRRSGLVRPEGIDRVWEEFSLQDASWARAWSLVVLGRFLNRVHVGFVDG